IFASICRVTLLFDATYGFLSHNPNPRVTFFLMQFGLAFFAFYSVVVRSKLEGAVRSKLEKSRGFFLLHCQGSQGPLFEGCFRSEEHTSELQSLRHLVC